MLSPGALSMMMSNVVVVSGSSALPATALLVLVAHKPAHEEHTESDDGEDDAENEDHLPRVGRRLRHERRVDRLDVQLLLEEALQVVHAVIEHVLPG